MKHTTTLVEIKLLCMSCPAVSAQAHELQINAHVNEQQRHAEQEANLPSE